MVDAGERERGIEDDPARRRLLNQLHQQGCKHPWRLADEEDHGNYEQGTSQAPVVGLTLVRRQIGLRRRS